MGGGGFKISNFNIFWGFQKINVFWSIEIFLEIFFFFWGGGGGSSQNWTVFRGHFYAYQGFPVKEQNGGYFWGLLKFQIFFGVLEIPVIILG